MRIEKLGKYGATVVLRGNEHATAYAAAIEHASTAGAVYCHAYDQPAIAAGAGTLGQEILEDLAGKVDSVVLAAGGGGLMAGVAAATEGEAVVVGVEPLPIPTLHTTLNKGGPTDVSDDDITQARRLLWDEYRIVVEHGAAAALAALTSGAYRPAPGERFAVVLCGANTDPPRYI